jgi:hypothetical protein
VDDQPHYVEEKVRTVVKEKGQIMERPRFSFDDERPKLVERTISTREHNHRSHRRRYGDRSDRAEQDRNHQAEEDREARRRDVRRINLCRSHGHKSQKTPGNCERKMRREELEKLSEQSGARPNY